MMFMIHMQTLKTTRDALIGIFLLASVALSLLMPIFASAQTAPATSGGIGNAITTALSNAVTGTLNGPGGANPGPTKCDGGFVASVVSGSAFNPVCWFRVTVSVLSAALIQMAVWVLGISGMLFNLLVDHTIINFGQFLYSDSVKNAVETAWTAFRDIS